MSILSHHITRREVPLVRKALAKLGYIVSATDAYRVVCNLASFLEPGDPYARRRIERLLCAVVEDCQAGDGYGGQEFEFFAEEVESRRQQAIADEAMRELMGMV